MQGADNAIADLDSSADRTSVLQPLQIALMGLPNADESLMRGYLRLYSAQRPIQLNWVPAGQGLEDVLLVNHLFMQSAQIKRLAESSEMRILWLERDHATAFEQIADRQYVMSLPAISTQLLYAALDQVCGITAPQRWSMTSKDNKSQSKPAPSVILIDSTETINSLETSASASPEPKAVDHPVPTFNLAGRRGVQGFEWLHHLTALQTDGALQQAGRILGWLDASRGVIWPIALPTDLQPLTLHPGPIPEAVHHQAPIPLQVWKWRLAWQLAQVRTDSVLIRCAHWRLLHWPQPQLDMPESAIFQVCGHLQVSQQATLSELVHRTGVEAGLVERILHALSLAALSIPVEAPQHSNKPSRDLQATDSVPVPSTTSVTTLPTPEGIAGLRGVLGRLRAKLGL